jgi:hypothetical protein
MVGRLLGNLGHAGSALRSSPSQCAHVLLRCISGTFFGTEDFCTNFLLKDGNDRIVLISIIPVT